MEELDLIDSVNIAESLDEKQLIKIGKECSEGYKTDKSSRADLEDLWTHWTKIALQVTEQKTFPWPGAANVKYPLLSIAAMQFAARAYPTLIPSNGEVVKAKVFGPDPTGEKTQRAFRVGKFMSWQVMEEMYEWEDEMDRLLITLPILGTVFKKTYFDPSKGRNKSCLIMPTNLVVNYWAKNLCEAERITEIIPMSKRIITERVRAGLFLDVDLGEPQAHPDNLQEVKAHKLHQPEVDETTPYNILEQHTYLDLDEDGYPEPYIVTFEENTEKVLRIVARYDEDSITLNENGEIQRIEPIEYYTKYGFIPNPDGGFYDIGFGRLLGPINDACDTLTNQLIDAGTLANMQSGFIGKGLRLRMGDNKFAPGEWKAVNATGDDLKKQIVPLPAKDPSNVLFQLLTFLIEAGNKLASVAEIMVGKMPGQNTPATTTMATIEQGMKVFTAVYKRVYRSLTDEFHKLYYLNQKYFEQNPDYEELSQLITIEDFQLPKSAICPAADPSAVSNQEKQAKVEAVGKLLNMGTINPMAFTQMYLDAFEVPGAEQLIMQPQPQPNPEAEKMQMEMQMKQEDHRLKMESETLKMRIKEAEGREKVRLQRELAQQKIQSEAVKGHLERSAAAMNHQQTMLQGAEQHAVRMEQQKQAAKQQPKQTPKKDKK